MTMKRATKETLLLLIGALLTLTPSVHPTLGFLVILGGWLIVITLYYYYRRISEEARKKGQEIIL